MFSRLLPSGPGRSFYDDLRSTDRDGDLEDRAGLLDEENLNHQFHEYDLDHAEELGDDDSRLSLERAARRLGIKDQANRRPHMDNAPGWFTHDVEDDGNNDVPASLLVEPHDVGPATRAPQRMKQPDYSRPNAVPGPSTRKARSQWDTAQAQQRLHHDDGSVHPLASQGPHTLMTGPIAGNAKKKAEWRWATVSNLDQFIKDVYDYYYGCGIWCILLERFLHLL